MSTEFKRFLEEKKGKIVEAAEFDEAGWTQYEEHLKLLEQLEELDRKVEADLKRYKRYIEKWSQISDEVVRLRKQHVPVPEIAERLKIKQAKVVQIMAARKD